MCGLVISAALLAAEAVCQTPAPTNAEAFQSTVGPLLRAKCAPCHNPNQRSGGLDLIGEAAARRGGAHGAPIKPGDPEASLLFQKISTRQMPPGMPLSATEVESVRGWIASGAAWSAEPPRAAPPAARAGADWWSLRPLARPAVPLVHDRKWVANPIDAFVLANLERRGLHPAPPADRAKLIRRVYYDMLGAQPAPEEIRAFVADRAPDAYPRLVDRVLADPRYGERWGRHWLDVARFSESQGFERDAIRDHAWPYRDYVIDSLNADKPYDRFVREQIAGDVLPGATAETIAATGFLVAGPYDEAGNSSVSASLRAMVREEELEDMLAAVGQTFLGLTVNCARCHDHKFDPILQRDYYRLKAVFDGVHGGDRPMPPTAEQRARQAERDRARAAADSATEEIRVIEAGARTREELWDVPDVPLPLARWSFVGSARDTIGGMDGTLRGGAELTADGLRLNGKAAFVETQPLRRDLRAKTLEAWLLLPNRDQRGGAALSIQMPGAAAFDGVVFGERQPRKWIAGSSLFERTRDLDAPEETTPPGSPIHVAVAYGADNRITVYRNGAVYGATYVPDGPNSALRTFKAGEGRALIGLRHSGAPNGFLEGTILEARLYDRALTAAQVAASYRAGPRRHPPIAPVALSQERAQRLAQLAAERDRMEAIASGPTAPDTVYAARPAQPAETFVLLRGSPEAHGPQVTAGGIGALGASDFGLPASAPEGERRLRFADWLVRPENGLAARVMVNRVWHYHFGRGIVGTPNDFGFNGEKPTNPELLDWLAATFSAPERPTTRSAGGTESPRNGERRERPGHDLARVPVHPITSSPNHHFAWRLKPLHRLILLSNTYRQSAAYDPAAARRDADDRWLWRFEPRRLEGEAIRDAMLVASGRIDWKRGGPGFRPFVETVNNSHFYAVFDKDGPEFNRRTVYRINVDSAKSTLLETLDCPDPSTKIPRRSVTTTPLQALELMNNRFVLDQARFFAARIRADAGPDPAKQADRAYLLALGRAPLAAERIRAVSLVRKGAAATLCWALFNSTEFLTVR
ncbi:MAG TPA: DUF1549 domain-containing protein [Chthonomonadaceae bacterium]|nr:DUF1549 domain-containing protein [Chthonomonadaceae bacterium]